MLLRINEDAARDIGEGVIIRPGGEDGFRGIAQVNLEALGIGKLERDRTFPFVRKRDLDLHLARFRELERLGREFEREHQAAQPRVLVLGQGLTPAKGIEPAQPTAPLRLRWPGGLLR